MAQQLINLTSVHEDGGSTPGLSQWVKNLAFPVSYGVGCRCGSDSELLWLWCRSAAAAPSQPLAWELPCAAGAALKIQKKKKKVQSREYRCRACVESLSYGERGYQR